MPGHECSAADAQAVTGEIGSNAGLEVFTDPAADSLILKLLQRRFAHHLESIPDWIQNQNGWKFPVSKTGKR